ncbi:MAG: hypothetical protein ACF8LK_08210 [Phycisphaerales bacterium JB041]
MGFFERKLGAIGEAVDDGLERARDHAGEMCDRRGWADRAAAARERSADGLGAAVQTIGERWRALGREAQRLTLGGAALLFAVVVVLVLRGTLLTPVEPVRDADLELLESLRAKQAEPRQWLGRAEPSGRGPTPPAVPAGWR